MELNCLLTGLRGKLAESLSHQHRRNSHEVRESKEKPFVGQSLGGHNRPPLCRSLPPYDITTRLGVKTAPILPGTPAVSARLIRNPLWWRRSSAVLKITNQSHCCYSDGGEVVVEVNSGVARESTALRTTR